MTFLSPAIGNPGGINWGRETQYAACISPLLDALGWRGDAAQVIEAMPHYSSTMDLMDFRSSLANLNFESKPTKSILAELDIRLMPCLFDSKGGSVFVLFSADENGIQAFDAATQGYVEISKEEAAEITGTAFFFRPIDREKIGQWSNGKHWFQTVLSRFMPLIRRILMMTFILNLLALATPLFIMAVYDLVIGSGSFDTLNYLLVGVGLALLCDVGLRYMRGTMLAYIGARLDYIIGRCCL